MDYYIEQIKNWKNLGKTYRKWLMTDLIRNFIFMLLLPLSYMAFKDTGLLIYIILILKYRWYNDKGSK